MNKAIINRLNSCPMGLIIKSIQKNPSFSSAIILIYTANENLETRPLSLIGAVQIGASERFNNSERLLLFISFNMFVGVFNLLPLLPLDGGHLLVASYERVREGRSGKRYMVDISRLMPITYVVIIFLAFFGIGAIYLDIANPLNF